MYEEYRVGAVLLLGGEGLRLRGQWPKQFLWLGGKRIYFRALEPFLALPLFDEIVLACHPEWLERVQEEVSSFERVRCVAGGKTRQASSYGGLLAFSSKPDIVLIHDGVRPFVEERILVENIEGAIAYGAVDTCIPSADTLVFAPKGDAISSIPQRKEFWRGQTPQGFRYEEIVRAHREALQKGICDASDDCRLFLEMGKPVGLVKGSELNIKITSEWDLLLAEALLEKERI